MVPQGEHNSSLPPTLFSSHSLTLCLPQKNISSYRVGNDAYSTWFSNNSPAHYRLVHNKDPVPHLPPMNFGFHHPLREVYYVDDYTSPTLCEGDGEDLNCSDHFAVDLNVGECQARSPPPPVLRIILFIVSHSYILLYYHSLMCVCTL
jgi:hypothetical protein